MFVFDRGYASKNLILFIEDDMHCRYLFRVRDKFNLEVDALPAPDSKDGVADHTISLYGGHRDRVIKFFLPSGILETLITNDFEMEAWKFRQIYFHRWAVEETYKKKKKKTGLTNFNGWAENSIRQEFWVTLLLANLSLAIKKETDGIVKHEQQSGGSTNNKHLYQTNMNELSGAISRRFSMYIDAYADGADVRTLQAVVKNIFSFAVSHRVIDKKGTGESNLRREPRKAKHHYNVKLTH